MSIIYIQSTVGSRYKIRIKCNHSQYITVFAVLKVKTVRLLTVGQCVHFIAFILLILRY